MFSIKTRTHIRFVFASVFVIQFLFACGSAKKMSDSYTPSAEILHSKADQPVIRLWDRWSEKRSSLYRLPDSTLLSRESTRTLLADDPDPTVRLELDKVEAHEKYMAFSSIAMTVAIIGSIASFTSEKPSSDGTKAAWIGATVGTIGLTFTFDHLKNIHFESAISQHNRRISHD